MNGRKNRRLRNYLISNRIQMRVILLMLLHILLVLTVTLAVTLGPMVKEMLFSPDLEVQYQAAQHFLEMVKTLVPAVTAIFFLVFLHQVLITHRICGPLVNFSNTFERIAQGDLTRKIRLRRADYLTIECNRINAMVENLGEIITQINADQEKLSRLLEETLSHTEDSDACQRLEEALVLLQEQADAVTRNLQRFKLQT